MDASSSWTPQQGESGSCSGRDARNPGGSAADGSSAECPSRLASAYGARGVSGFQAGVIGHPEGVLEWREVGPGPGPADFPGSALPAFSVKRIRCTRDKAQPGTARRDLVQADAMAPADALI